MRFTDTPELATWRQQVQGFLDEHWHSDDADADVTGLGEQANPERRKAYEAKVSSWLDALGGNGWLSPAWPKKYGGADMSVIEQFVLSDELNQAGAPTSRQMLNLVGPTIMVHGSESQRQEHLPPMLRGEVAWCQGFSEPGSGSDLASLQTRAERDGDEYVVSGQKIWTSGAHTADWIFLLTRTDPDAPKHRGISYLLVDMKQPGISVRPLINMVGGHVFNEVFFEDVRVPVGNRIGEENRGWYVGTTTLDFERSNIARVVGIQKQITSLSTYLQRRAEQGRPVKDSYRMEVTERALETAVCQLLSFQVVSIQAAGGVPNMEASMNKMYGSELQQRCATTQMHVTGMEGQLGRPDDPLARECGLRPALSYLGTVSATIAAGTSEIQRNIIATRGLELPRA